MNNSSNDFWRSQAMFARMQQRYRAERRFQWMGRSAALMALGFLGFLLYSIVAQGVTAFSTTRILLPVTFSAEVLDPAGEGLATSLPKANLARLVRDSLKTLFPEVTERRDQRLLHALVSKAAEQEIAEALRENPSWLGTEQPVWVTASSLVDMLRKGRIDPNAPEADRKLNDRQIAWIGTLKDSDRLARGFNTLFFTTADSRNPEEAGILGSIIGSLFVVVVCLLVALPLGVLTAIYLEEFAPQNRFVELIEININNLAAVPSIIFGLLGVTVYIQLMALPRSSALVGGLTLALMILPTIIITTRMAIKAVPPSIREAAQGLGASPMQVVAHHVLPLALPGIMTGTILGMARALGETAPLLMVGMVAFVVDVPTSLVESTSVMPVQVFLWSDSPEVGFQEKTSACIMVLLFFLIVLNAVAVYLRRKFERRW